MSEDIVDSWEDLEDNGELDKRLKNLVPTQSNSEESQKQTDGAASGVKLQEDNGGRTPYKPSVRILKREPNATGQNNLLSARAAQSKPIRTLEEREAAYAEARLRILGSAESPQESNLNNGEVAAAAATAATASSSNSSSSGSAPAGKPSTDGGAGSSSAAPVKGPTKDPSPTTSR